MTALVFALLMTADPLHITRSQSPWSGLVSKDEHDDMHVDAVPFTDALEKIPRLDALIGALTAHSLIAIDRKAGRVVTNEKLLSALSRVDALRLKDKHVVGTVKDKALLADLRKLATFFVASSIVQTYAHMGSDLRISKETNGAFEFDGEHEYFTNKRNVARVHFLLTIDKTSGVVTVSPL